MATRTSELFALNYPGKTILSAAVAGDCLIYSTLDIEQVAPAFQAIDAWPSALRVYAMIGHDLSNWFHFPPSAEYPTGIVSYSEAGAQQLLNVAPYSYLRLSVGIVGTAAQIMASVRGVRDE